MYAIIGMVIGLILDCLIIKPIQHKRIREKCVKDGLVPRNLL
jgi:hypothetical protein